MIEVNGLSKSFGPIRAVDRVSFSVKKGDVLGFLGPNGAGKSTTMRMLSCFLPPDEGTASILGFDIVKNSVEVRRRIGYLAENVPAYDEMTPGSFLGFVCDTRGIRGGDRHAAIDRIAETCSLTKVMHQPIGTLSKGFRRRLGLAQALVHDPAVLILDEPTDGLDPNQKYEVRQLIGRLAGEKCMIISTHILEEVDAMCSRIIIIAQGRIQEDSTPAELRKREGGTLEEIFRKLTARVTDRVAGGKTMRGFLGIFKRELRGYFSTPLAYVFLVIFLAFATFMTFQKGFYEMRYASLRVFFTNMPLLFIFLAPAMAMRLWAEERRSNSIEFFLTLPVTVTQAVLGKFFAAWTVIALALALTCPMVFTVRYLGHPDLGPIVSGYFGSLLLAGMYLAIGSFFSSLTRNQVIAFVLSVVACAVFLYASSPMTMDYMSRVLPVGLVEVIESLSTQMRFESLMRGVVEARDVAFFVILGAAWLGANVLTLKERMAAG